MRFGITITAGYYNYDSTPADFARMIRERIDWAKAARDAGFGFVSLGQHVLGRPPQHMLPQTLPMLARLSGEVPEMHLLTSVLIAPLYNPVILAEEVATLDGLCDGKFILCLGLGYREHEFLAFGAQKSERVARTEELVQVMKMLWTQDEVAHDGRFFKVHGPGCARQVLHKPHPTLWLGTGSEAGTRRAARIADGVYRAAFTPLAGLEQQLRIYNEALQAEGKAPAPRGGTFAMQREVYLGPSRARVAADAVPGFQKTMAAYKVAGVEDSMIPSELVGDRNLTADHLPYLMGSPAECAEQLALYRDRLGVEWMNLGFTASGIPHEQIMKNIQTFGREVLPQLKTR